MNMRKKILPGDYKLQILPPKLISDYLVFFPCSSRVFVFLHLVCNPFFLLCQIHPHQQAVLTKPERKHKQMCQNADRINLFTCQILIVNLQKRKKNILVGDKLLKQICPNLEIKFCPSSQKCDLCENSNLYSSFFRLNIYSNKLIICHPLGQLLHQSQD